MTAYILLKSGKYRDISGSERDRLFFLGDVKNPFAVGTMGEIFDTVDETFYNILDMQRWVKCGMIKLDVEKHPAYMCIGVRALMEAS